GDHARGAEPGGDRPVADVAHAEARTLRSVSPMTVPPTEPPPRGENTRAVHLPPPPVPSQPSIGTPVWRTASVSFPNSHEHADVLGDRAPGYSYSRVDNPTSDAFAQAVAALEGVRAGGGVTGQAFASGMAAISAVLLAFTHAGAHVVAPAAAYGGTHGLL